MPNQLRSNVVALLLVLVPTLSKAQFGRPGPMHRAEELVTVVFDPTLQLSPQMINEVAGSKDVAGAAASELTGKPVRLQLEGDTRMWVDETTSKQYFAWTDVTRRLPTVAGQFPLTLRVGILGEDDSNEAEKYIPLVISRLNKVVAEISRRQYEHRLNQLKEAEEQSKISLDHAHQKLLDLRARLRHGYTPLTEPILEELVSDLKKQQQALQLELAGMKGRTEALQQELVKSAERAKKQPAADEVLENLRRVVALRTSQFQAIQALHERGTATATEVAKAEEQVALAQVELAQAQRAVARPNAEVLDKLNNELAQIAVNRAEIEAKLKYVTQSLEDYFEVLHREAQAKTLRQQLEKHTGMVASLQSKADKAATELKQLESSFRPARVEVFELTPDKEKEADAKKEDR